MCEGIIHVWRGLKRQDPRRRPARDSAACFVNLCSLQGAPAAQPNLLIKLENCRLQRSPSIRIVDVTVAPWQGLTSHRGLPCCWMQSTFAANRVRPREQLVVRNVVYYGCTGNAFQCPHMIHFTAHASKREMVSDGCVALLTFVA